MLRTFWRKKYDANLVVIGAGAAGLVSAYIASAVKAKVFLIEKHLMGGDCLNTGCVPSKALIRAAKLYHQIQNSERYGIVSSEVAVDFNAVMERVKSVVAEVEPHDSVERYESLGVDCVSGEATIVTPHLVRVGDREISTRHIIVATGARPAVPNIPGLADTAYLTSDNLWELKTLPKKLVVVGGGPIGCELAQAFSRLGSEVTVVDVANKLLPRADEDVSTFIAQQFAEENITLELGATLSSVKNNAATITRDGVEKSIPFDQILIAVGRQANTDGFGLQTLGVALNANGTIKVDPFLRTNINNILACGDVAGPYQFTHTASHQAWYACVNALFSSVKKFKVDYSVIPWVIFTDPEIAHVGQSETDLTHDNIAYEKVCYDLSDLDRAIADGDNHGFVKVMLKKGSDKILGATIVGAHAGELLPEFVMAMKNNIGLNKILGTIHSYPTWSEANKYVAGVWKKAHALEGLLKWVKRYHDFRRGGG